MDVERLVKLVRQHEFLYDVTNKDYKNIRLKAAVWENIGKELNDTGENAKLKWKTVRDGYIKYKKQILISKQPCNYIWSQQLKFLEKYKVSRRGHGYINNVPPESFQAEQYDDSMEQEEATAMPQSPAQLVSMGMLISPEGSQQPYHVDVSQQSLPSDHCEPKIQIYDATDHLFLSYSQTFKKFSPREQALLKIDLAKLFANAELRELYGGEDPPQTATVVKRECETSEDPLSGMLANQTRNDT